MNRNYLRSRAKETQVKHILEKSKYYAIRAAGSKGVADVIGMRYPKDCAYPNHFEVKLIQIKVSEGLKKGSITPTICKTPCGEINVEVWKFPVKSKKWNKKFSKKAKRLKARLVIKAKRVKKGLLLGRRNPKLKI